MLMLKLFPMESPFLGQQPLGIYFIEELPKHRRFRAKQHLKHFTPGRFIYVFLVWPVYHAKLSDPNLIYL